MISVAPVAGLPEICPGADPADMIGSAVADVAMAGDILVVTQKIVSKAQDRFVNLSDVQPGEDARALAAVVLKDPRLVELVLRESVAVVRAAPHVLITRHRSGHVMANAGIDQSNLGGGAGDRVLLLPEDSDAAARGLATVISSRLGYPMPVVISDSFGRPWRVGVVNVAIGCSGLAALVDHRGTADRDGRRMEVTQVALADMVATAAGLAMGEGREGIPAALVRGVAWTSSEQGVRPLIRPPEQDLFR